MQQEVQHKRYHACMNEASSSNDACASYQEKAGEPSGHEGADSDICAQAMRVKRLSQNLFIDSEWLLAGSFSLFSAGLTT